MKDSLYKILSILSMTLNGLSFVLGLFYIINPAGVILWQVFGIIFLLTLLINIFSILLNDIWLNRADDTGKKLSLLGYIYLYFSLAAFYGMCLGNVAAASVYSSKPQDYSLINAVIYFSYFGLIVLGFFLAYNNYGNFKRSGLWEYAPGIYAEKKFLHRFIKAVLKFFIVYFHVLLAFYGALLVLFGKEIAGPGINKAPDVFFHGGAGVFISQFGLFYALGFLSITLILLKSIDRREHPFRYKAVLASGFILSLILFLPLASTPGAISSAEKNFTEAFGKDWRGNIPAGIGNAYFRKTPFLLPEYFLGMKINDYEVEVNRKYYEAGGRSFYYDAYFPPEGKSDLPGGNSVIIRIHGGGWKVGDKGFFNMMQMNKYFASQGYVVFDIQYGLNNREEDFKIIPTPPHVIGDYTVDDMLVHIGIFIRYLKEHAEDYEADLDSVFISGGSAGGHLACAAALAISSGKYDRIFPGGIKIRGFIPYYPGNGLSPFLGVKGSSFFINPEELITGTSPPCLIHQGTGDGIVATEIVEKFLKTYREAGNNKCAVIWAPLAGHANDFYFTGYYNQVFLYYMERFLYLCVNDVIK